MSIFTKSPALRWAVPSAAAVALIGGSAAVGALTANADAGLQPRTAAQLLVDVQQARLDGLSGTVVQRADLGIPSLPGMGGGSGSSDMTSLVSGTHTLRVWFAGPDKARLALLGDLGESDVVKNGTDLWTWSSHDNTATHRTLSPGDHAAKAPSDADVPKTPQEAADAALKAIGPTTQVSTSGTATVAGRSAYELLLEPRDRASLIAQVRIAVDGVKHVPLRVQVYAQGAAEPAFEVGFTSVDFARPDAGQFTFNPPPGAKVSEASPTGTEKMGQARPNPEAGTGKPATSAARPKVVGTGWTTVVVAKLPTGAAAPSGTDSSTRRLTGLVSVLPKVSGAWGSGHLLAGKLFSVVLTDDGRVAVGAVRPDALFAALAAK